MKSLWEMGAPLLGENTGGAKRCGVGSDSWDVVVIGAGMTGLLCAYFLQQRGKRVLVLDAGRIAGGQTGRTTAKITSQHGMIYTRLISQLGQERAALYARANQRAIRDYAGLAALHAFLLICIPLRTGKPCFGRRRQQQAWDCPHIL